MGVLRVPNFEKWQHYKDRTPPWIKLHRDLLNDYDFSCLQDASKAHLIQIWLLASQMDNAIPADAEWIAKRINATDCVDIKLLIDKGFLELASGVIADCKQDAMRETETETETEIKHYSASDDAGAVDRPKYSDSFEAFWSEYPNKKDKAKAYAAWKRKKLDSMSAQLIERVRDQKARDAQWLAGFIPHGSTYINGERWEDEIETQRGGRGGSHRKTHADYRRELEQAAEPGVRVVSGERLD